YTTLFRSIVIANEDGSIDEDDITLEAIEAGAEDISKEEDIYEVTTVPEDFKDVCNHLKSHGYELDDAEVTLIPQTYTSLSEKDEEKMLNLIEMLEDEEDVQDIHHNLKQSEKVRNFHSVEWKFYIFLCII